ncbi:hypothetical protein Pyrfu_1721 [Pyrolobus fumarii 1A]|uniref:Uncharacterized protein n=1 Tax=Pyrolobus fumarii (strain DSM 11204 / 1A) TaxID=694429 RepID=G0ECK6_PYRF1|nr:hypothetical protein [Pyrolobus fumarii]AEM39576.1 hypothetical protein Pyrfu_1721 [Pyrolobus fumarii 1A]
MSKPQKLVLVTAEHHPLHKQWVKLAEELAKEKGLELEIRMEDYVLLNECGEQDEFGMAWLPQLLVMLDDGSCKLVLSKIPLDNTLQPDLESAKKQALERLSQLG